MSRMTVVMLMKVEDRDTGEQIDWYTDQFTYTTQAGRDRASGRHFEWMQLRAMREHPDRKLRMSWELMGEYPRG